ncbi:aldose 1-epimerase family protein [Rhodococcus antarcticus]|uniref:Aldose 1-epimerase family protein n=1 Tax=Rhodococcus antarcticus TaxID=2987751 RepID=A0ABY6P2Y0_9NOCA|nr:aldose 1-epimerase family protein [Rhodococcus antarcticus]UZJ26009.1 aldose 1-epimerase family protein [Rhodococcus antarcticus]
MTPPPSGQQLEITHGDQRATIVEVGGGVRTYTAGGRDVLHPYDLDAMCDGAHGAPLIPWPNRLADGRYTFDGKDHQVALTEPDKHNAIHGLLRWRSWQATERAADRVVMATVLHPMLGYPFTLAVQVEYALGAHGLSVVTTATNVGDTPCPYGHGQHPYLSPGRGTIDACTLQLSADTRILTDRQRQLPIGSEPVARTPFDFTTPRQLKNLEVDSAFTGLGRDAEGKAWVRLTGTDGATAALWVDETYPILELYTADTLAPARRRTGLGAEPMTCPPNAFQTGQHVIRLDPGQSQTTTWGANLS